MQLKIDEISKVIKEQIKHYSDKTTRDETGNVIQVGDGIAKVFGLDQCRANELLKFCNGSYGMALNLEENYVSAWASRREAWSPEPERLFRFPLVRQ